MNLKCGCSVPSRLTNWNGRNHYGGRASGRVLRTSNFIALTIGVTGTTLANGKDGKKCNTHARCGTGRGANSMERTVRVPDVVEETRFANEVNRTLEGHYGTNYRKKITLESTGAMKAQPARTSHNNQLELALHKRRNLQHVREIRTDTVSKE